VIAVADLRCFAATFTDLDDPEVMSGASELTDWLIDNLCSSAWHQARTPSS
jgi:hypothetical protein